MPRSSKMARSSRIRATFRRSGSFRSWRRVARATEREDGHDFGSALRRGSPLDGAAEKRHPFSHPGQPHALTVDGALPRGRDVEPDPVVADAQRQAAGILLDLDGRLSGARVLEDIGERLLSDPEAGDLD